MQPEQLLTAKDVAERARVHIVTFYRWVARGIGPPAIRVGGATRYRPQDIEKWLASDHLRTKR